ncbi:hypothetical protein KCP73_07755 [Salmonella enterica subsp. enterica]|nr:hypothetical protein KCP73_07755 [Salmonella enterica subsp. enterica]
MALQKEVVNRLVAGPNSKAYVSLSVMAILSSGDPVRSKCRHYPPTPPPKVGLRRGAFRFHAPMLTRLKIFAPAVSPPSNRRKTIRVIPKSLPTVRGTNPQRAKISSVAQHRYYFNYPPENAPWLKVTT